MMMPKIDSRGICCLVKPAPHAQRVTLHWASASAIGLRPASCPILRSLREKPALSLPNGWGFFSRSPKAEARALLLRLGLSARRGFRGRSPRGLGHRLLHRRFLHCGFFAGGFFTGSLSSTTFSSEAPPESPPAPSSDPYRSRTISASFAVARFSSRSASALRVPSKLFRSLAAPENRLSIRTLPSPPPRRPERRIARPGSGRD